MRQMSEQRSNSQLPQPPSEFFEPSVAMAICESLDDIPTLYIRRALNMIELPIGTLLESEDIDIVDYEANERIIGPEDAHTYIYAVIEGVLDVYISRLGEKEYMLKHIDKGDAFFSSISIVEVLSHNEPHLERITLRANRVSKVARYNISHLHDRYRRHPEEWVRSLQVIFNKPQIYFFIDFFQNCCGQRKILSKTKLGCIIY